MKITVESLVFNAPDKHIKSFKTKESFIKSQLKDFDKSGIDEEVIKKVSNEMYESLNPQRKEKD